MKPIALRQKTDREFSFNDSGDHNLNILPPDTIENENGTAEFVNENLSNTSSKEIQAIHKPNRASLEMIKEIKKTHKRNNWLSFSLKDKLSVRNETDNNFPIHKLVGSTQNTKLKRNLSGERLSHTFINTTTDVK